MTNNYISSKNGRNGHGTLRKFKSLLRVATPQELREYANRLLLPHGETDTEKVLNTEYYWQIAKINYSAHKYFNGLEDDERFKRICNAFKGEPFNWSEEWARGR